MVEEENATSQKRDSLPVDILVVDDREENLLAIGRMLASSSLNVVTARNGNEALAKVLELPFACVLLDVQMPSLNGLEVAQILHDDPVYCSLPVIFMTAYRGNESDVEEGYRTGAVDYLFKPLNPAVVRSKVRVFAELYRRQRANRELNVALQRIDTELRQVMKVMAHDLKEPARVLVNYCDALRREIGIEASQATETCLGYVSDSSRRLCTLLDSFVTFLEIRHISEANESVSMQELALDVVRELQQKVDAEHAEIQVERLPQVIGNRSQLHLVLWHLFGNALRYRSEKPVRIRVTARLEKGQHVIAVHDTSRGIDERNRERVFDLFTRVEHEGLGTGLATCRKIVEAHGGRIWVESDPGRGSSFYFTVPAVGEPR